MCAAPAPDWDVADWAERYWRAEAPPECLLVLAGGVDDAGQPHATVARRLDAAAELYRRSGGRLRIIANGGGACRRRKLPRRRARLAHQTADSTRHAGTAHKPRWRDAAGFATPEASIMAAGLAARGVPLSAIVLESLSDDTLGNAFAARALHTEWRPDWRRLLLITSDFQLPRAQAVYEWIFGLSPPPAVGPRYELRCAGVPDAGALPEDALAARCAREAASLASFSAGVGQSITTMAAAQQWLFTQHGAYAPPTKPREPVDAKVLASY